MTAPDREVILVANGPGELAAWARPVARALRQAGYAGRLSVALVPCPYAAGTEARAVAAWAEIDAVWEPSATWRWAIAGQPPAGAPAPARAGVVLFLGGDQAFAVALARRTGYRLHVYAAVARRHRAAVERFYAPAGPPDAQTAIVGDLMVDAVADCPPGAIARERLGLAATGRPLVALLPGSKDFKVRFVAPLMLGAADRLGERAEWLWVRSPFTPASAVEAALGDPAVQAITGGVGARWLEPDRLLETPSGVRVHVTPATWEAQRDALAAADLALAIPGTNTAELAVLGVPTLVVTPLNRPEVIPLDGLVGRLLDVPGLRRLKRVAAWAVMKRAPLLALPNQRAGRMIAPELLGALSPADVAAALAPWLDDAEGRREMGEALRRAMGEAGAAARIASGVLAALAPEEARAA